MPPVSSLDPILFDVLESCQIQISSPTEFREEVSSLHLLNLLSRTFFRIVFKGLRGRAREMLTLPVPLRRKVVEGQRELHPREIHLGLWSMSVAPDKGATRGSEVLSPQVSIFFRLTSTR